MITFDSESLMDRNTSEVVQAARANHESVWPPRRAKHVDSRCGCGRSERHLL